jgi:hypothetical protein
MNDLPCQGHSRDNKKRDLDRWADSLDMQIKQWVLGTTENRTQWWVTTYNSDRKVKFILDGHRDLKYATNA